MTDKRGAVFERRGNVSEKIAPTFSNVAALDRRNGLRRGSVIASLSAIRDAKGVKAIDTLSKGYPIPETRVAEDFPDIINARGSVRYFDTPSPASLIKPEIPHRILRPIRARARGKFCKAVMGREFRDKPTRAARRKPRRRWCCKLCDTRNAGRNWVAQKPGFPVKTEGMSA